MAAAYAHLEGCELCRNPKTQNTDWTFCLSCKPGYVLNKDKCEPIDSESECNNETEMEWNWGWFDMSSNYCESECKVNMKPSKNNSGLCDYKSYCDEGSMPDWETIEYTPNGMFPLLD